MEKPVKGVVKLGIIIVLALVVGASAVFAINQPDTGVAADAVAILKSQGVTCGSCAGRIEAALREKPGVASVEVDVDAGRVAVAYDSKVARAETLAETVTAAGYGSSILQVLTSEQYTVLTGRNVPVRTAKTGGCGGG
ncbi:MAG TPA: heavy metal-associated domain-containing protein, partial [Geobacteraceae bacterium]